MPSKKSISRKTVYFADARVEALESSKTLPAKFMRMLDRLKLEKRVKGKKVGIKMHLGGNIGYSTIPPLFIRMLVQALKDSGAKSVKAMDGNASDGIARGYTPEVLGCPVVPCFGESGKYLYPEKIGYKKLDSVFFGGEAVDCDFFLDLSHVKGHGDCGFGGALKNIAMGVINAPSRAKIHNLEGGIKYDPKRCTFCLKCQVACPNNAIRPNKKTKRIGFFFRNCTYCQHCIMACPTDALKLTRRKYEDFTNGMASVTAAFLKRFSPENLLFINFLTHITIYCDCWGMTTPALVPDIGILASEDIAAVDTASLDMIKTENLLPSGMPGDRKLLDIDGHLFQKIHDKDPYLIIQQLEKYYDCSSMYRISKIK